MSPSESSPRPRRAVILAAGRGSRLDGTELLPKPLTVLNGRRLIDYTLDALCGAGIGEALVVVGYRGDELRSALTMPRDLDLAFVTNHAWDGPASTSLRAARTWTGEDPFLLLMSDHLFSSAFVDRFLAAALPGESSVAADASPRPRAYVEEATLLDLDRERRVTAIGKGLPRWTALDSGAFIVQPAAWSVVDAIARPCELSIIFAEVARRQGLRAVDISGSFWYDVDTAEDLAAAAALLDAHDEPDATPLLV